MLPIPLGRLPVLMLRRLGVPSARSALQPCASCARFSAKADSPPPQSNWNSAIAASCAAAVVAAGSLYWWTRIARGNDNGPEISKDQLIASLSEIADGMKTLREEIAAEAAAIDSSMPDDESKVHALQEVMRSKSKALYLMVRLCFVRVCSS